MSPEQTVLFEKLVDAREDLNQVLTRHEVGSLTHQLIEQNGWHSEVCYLIDELKTEIEAMPASYSAYLSAHVEKIFNDPYAIQVEGEYHVEQAEMIANEQSFGWQHRDGESQLY